MTAPALLLVSPNVPEDAALLTRLMGSIRKRRPSLVCAAVDSELRTTVKVTNLLDPDVTEIVCVPLRAAGLTEISEPSETIRRYFAEHNPEARIYESDGLGAGSSLFNAVDRRLHDALAHNRAAELDALILAHDGELDSRARSAIERRSRVWSARHRLPCRVATVDPSETSTQLTSLASQGKRHIGVAVLSVLPTQLKTLEQIPQVAAVASSLEDDEAVIDEILSSYAVAAMRSLALAA